MVRPVAGVQLGRRAPPGFLRGLDAVVLALLVVSVWGGAAYWSVRAERMEIGRAGPTGGAGAGDGDAAPALDPGRAHEAAVLLLAGVADGPDIGAALDTVAVTASSDVRITEVEVRAIAGRGRVEAAIAAQASSAAAVARFLSALADHDAVLSTEVISETRQASGETRVRITAQLTAGRL